MGKLTDSLYFSTLLVVLSMISVTCGAAVAKSLFPLLGPEGTTFLRLGIGSILLFTLWRPWPMNLARSELLRIFVYGICLGGMNFLFYLAIARIPLGIAIAIEFLGPLSVALLLSQKRSDFLWIILAAAGVYLVLPTAASVAIDFTGILFALGAAVMWGLYIIIGKNLSGTIRPGIITSVGLLIACLIVSPFGLVHVVNAPLSSTLIWTALGVGLLSSAIPYSLEMIALKKMTSRHFGVFLSLEPAIGALAGFFIRDETLKPLQCLAILFIMLASIGSTVSSLGGRRTKDIPISQV